MGLDNPLHIIFIVVILLLLFGAKRLPEIGRSLGTGMREFKQSVTGEATSHSHGGQQAGQRDVAFGNGATGAPATSDSAAGRPGACALIGSGKRARRLCPARPGFDRAALEEPRALCRQRRESGRGMRGSNRDDTTWPVRSRNFRCAIRKSRRLTLTVVQDRACAERFELRARHPLELIEVFVVPIWVWGACYVPRAAVVGDD